MALVWINVDSTWLWYSIIFWIPLKTSMSVCLYMAADQLKRSGWNIPKHVCRPHRKRFGQRHHSASRIASQIPTTGAPQSVAMAFMLRYEHTACSLVRKNTPQGSLPLAKHLVAAILHWSNYHVTIQRKHTSENNITENNIIESSHDQPITLIDNPMNSIFECLNSP